MHDPQADVGTWAGSGGKWLTGRAEGPPLDVTGDPAGAIERALSQLRSRRDATDLPDARVLGERAALAELQRNGAVTAGGAGRLLRASDGWVALSLARPTDVELVPALTEQAAADDPWRSVSRWVDQHTREEFEGRATLLGLPASAVPAAITRQRPGVIVEAHNEPRTVTPAPTHPRVLDLSSLWAGPLCAYLLGLLGADVVKVESTRRPDGARRGNAAFYDLLHAGHRSVALDFTDPDDMSLLRRLITRADLVIEASRPRALQQRGIHAHDALDAGTSWLSITAYGRDGDNATRVGFGDDIAAGAGLLAWDDTGPVFAADALADPLTGALAAAAATHVLAGDLVALIDVSMRDLARECATLPPRHRCAAIAPPHARRAVSRAPSLGTHTCEVLDEW